MKRIKGVFYFMSILILCTNTNCSKMHHDDSMYFNGKIQNIEDGIKDARNLQLKPLPLNGANYGWIAAYDSLMFFMNSKLPNQFFNVFNIDTGEELGTFCNKGSGPEEAASVAPIFQLFKEGNELKTLLFAPYEERLLIWNITQSLEQGKTVLDRIIPYAWRDENKGACYNEMFLQDSNTLLTKVSAFPINDDDATLPFFQKRTLDTNKSLKDYQSYKQTIKNKELPLLPECFFNSNNTFKPDGTKIVQAMIRLPQLNIVDVQTGEVVGYRLNYGLDFSIFKGEKQLRNFYGLVQADDNYIYALYWGKVQWGDINTIYVFDWSGNLIDKLKVDHYISSIWLDTVRNRFYIIESKTDDVFYYELDELNKEWGAH